MWFIPEIEICPLFNHASWIFPAIFRSLIPVFTIFVYFLVKIHKPYSSWVHTMPVSQAPKPKFYFLTTWNVLAGRALRNNLVWCFQPPPHHNLVPINQMIRQYPIRHQLHQHSDSHVGTHTRECARVHAQHMQSLPQVSKPLVILLWSGKQGAVQYLLGAPGK